MFGSGRFLLPPLLIALAAVIRICPAFAQEFPLLEGHGRPQDVHQTFLDPRFKTCHSAECEGIRDVWDLIDLMNYRDMPNSLV